MSANRNGHRHEGGLRASPDDRVRNRGEARERLADGGVSGGGRRSRRRGHARVRQSDGKWLPAAIFGNHLGTKKGDTRAWPAPRAGQLLVSVVIPRPSLIRSTPNRRAPRSLPMRCRYGARRPRPWRTALIVASGALSLRSSRRANRKPLISRRQLYFGPCSGTL
jgi:hypothetical protein